MERAVLSRTGQIPELPDTLSMHSTNSINNYSTISLTKRPTPINNVTVKEYTVKEYHCQRIPLSKNTAVKEYRCQRIPLKEYRCQRIPLKEYRCQRIPLKEYQCQTLEGHVTHLAEHSVKSATWKFRSLPGELISTLHAVACMSQVHTSSISDNRETEKEIKGLSSGVPQSTLYMSQ